jgi:hypothetical protein
MAPEVFTQTAWGIVQKEDHPSSISMNITFSLSNETKTKLKIAKTEAERADSFYLLRGRHIGGATLLTTGV